ncbi:MAG: DUF4910 domain-containing protein [Candidatus Heimdallarchaeota archaeon]
MFQKILAKISKEFSGQNAKELIGGIANFHRIQSSPGYRDAAEFCHGKLEEYTIPFVKIHKYPAKGNNKYWGCPVPKEWSIKSASLEIVEPTNKAKILCRFFESPCSIIQRSKATAKDGITAEVIILPKGLSEDEMKGYDLKGKFILTDDPELKKLRLLAVNKLGAAGIIYDLVSELPPIRTRANFPTARRYTSFWYGTEGDEGDAFGFVLSAEQGDQLRKLIESVEKEAKKDGKKHKQVKLHAKIDASFYDGEMEVVDFTIPGKINDQEIIAVAHLCHPKPGAIDNASGCGTIIEVARTLNSLIESGKLDKPKRSIRFLLMAEYTGTFCYLASNEKKIRNFVAGINIDMVGADPAAGGGRTLIMERTHNSNPSYVNDVLSAILDCTSQQIPNFLNSGSSALFKFANDQPYSGGSDHEVLGDPDIDIATPMFIQWPDRYYHSGEDSIEKVSAELLQLIGSMTATYCYFIANAEIPEILWIIREITTKGKERITQFSRQKTTEFLLKLKEEKENETKETLLWEFFERIEAELNFRKKIELQALKTTLKLITKDEEKKPIDTMVQEMYRAIETHTEKELIQTKFSIEEISNALNIQPKIKEKHEELEIQKINGIIPKRVFRGPITGLSLGDLSLDDLKEMKEVDEEHKGMRPVLTSGVFWIDGKRTLGEIAELVNCDIGKTSIQYLYKMLKFYEKHGVVELELVK